MWKGVCMMRRTRQLQHFQQRLEEAKRKLTVFGEVVLLDETERLQQQLEHSTVASHKLQQMLWAVADTFCGMLAQFREQNDETGIDTVQQITKSLAMASGSRQQEVV
ncbi:MAG: hypothetical protein MHM6MM_003986 [Cercozoa sp. M6MM]